MAGQEFAYCLHLGSVDKAYTWGSMSKMGCSSNNKNEMMPAFISYIQTFTSCEGHSMGEFPVIFYKLKDMVCGKQGSLTSRSEPSGQEYAHTPKDMYLRSSVLFQRCVGSQNLLSGMEFLRNPHLAVTSCCSDELEG